MLLLVALGQRLHPESLISRHWVEVFIISGNLYVISKLIDAVVFSGFLSFKAFMHGGNTVISSRLVWFRAVVIEVAFLSIVEAFLPGVILRLGWWALLGLGFGRRDGLIRARFWSLAAASISIAASTAVTGCDALSLLLDLLKVMGGALEVSDEVA